MRIAVRIRRVRLLRRRFVSRGCVFRGRAGICLCGREVALVGLWRGVPWWYGVAKTWDRYFGMKNAVIDWQEQLRNSTMLKFWIMSLDYVCSSSCLAGDFLVRKS